MGKEEDLLKEWEALKRKIKKQSKSKPPKKKKETIRYNLQVPLEINERVEQARKKCTITKTKRAWVLSVICKALARQESDY